MLFFFFRSSATSSKDDLHRRIGGRCSTNNMKVVFKVCCSAASTEENQPSVVSSTAVVASAVPSSSAGTSSSPSSPPSVTSGQGSTGISINTNIEQRDGGGVGNHQQSQQRPAVVQQPQTPHSTISWPRGSNPQSTVATTSSGFPPHQFYPPSHQMTSVRPANGGSSSANNNHQNNNSNYAPSHKPTKKSSKLMKNIQNYCCRNI